MQELFFTLIPRIVDPEYLRSLLEMNLDSLQIGIVEVRARALFLAHTGRKTDSISYPKYSFHGR